MDKGEKKDLTMLNDMFADDGEMDNESSDSDYEPNEKVNPTKCINAIGRNFLRHLKTLPLSFLYDIVTRKM